MTEIANSRWRPLDTTGLADRVDAALRRVVPPEATVPSVHLDHPPSRLPVPTLGRAALAIIQPRLVDCCGVLTWDRFGACWCQLGTTDHAGKMGIGGASLRASATPEPAWAL